MGGFLFYIGTLSFLLGVGVRTVIGFDITVGVLGLVVSVGLALLWRRVEGREEGVGRWIVLAAAISLFCFSLGLFRVEWADQHTEPVIWEQYVESEVVLEGRVVREPDVRANTQHLYTKVDDELLLVTTDRYANFSYGDVIAISGTLTKPEAFETDLGRTFNYPGYLQAQGVEYLIRYGQVELVASGQGNPVLAGLLTGKSYFQASLADLLPEPQLGLAEGLLLGEKRALGDEWTEIFRRTGIIHIVVLSGYNVALVVAFVLYVLSVFLPLRGRLWFGMAAIAAFALMVGLSATVLRASIMAALILLAQATGRIYLITRALLFTAVLMVLFNPYILIYDPGFQLSFLATLGLIVGAPWLQAKLGFVPSAIGVREFLTATVITQIFVLPLLLWQIGEFSVVSVLVNVLVLPLVPVAMLLTFITGMTALLSPTLALPFAHLTAWSLTYILAVAEWFAGLPFAAFTVPAFPFWLVIVSYLLLGSLCYWLWCRMQVGPTASNSVAGWTIVEEGDIQETKDGEEAEASSPSEVPIFFR